MHILGVPMMFIGFVLIVNAWWLQGKVETKDVGVFNVLVGLIAFLASLYYGVAQENFPLCAGGLLFAFTYLWIGVNALRGAEDQRALGYYCLLVAITTVPYMIKAFQGGDLGWAFSWATYGILWYLFYLLLAKGNTNIMGITIFGTFFVGIEVAITGWLYLYGYWPFGNMWPFN